MFAGDIFAATVQRRNPDGSLSTITTTLPVQIDADEPVPPAEIAGDVPVVRSTAIMLSRADLRLGDMITDPSTTDYATGQVPLWIVGWDRGRYPTHQEIGVYSLALRPVTGLYLQAFIPNQPGTTLCTCYDPKGGRTTQPDHPTCFGRGVVGGYATGVSHLTCLTYAWANNDIAADGYLNPQPADATHLILPVSVTTRPKLGDLYVYTPDPLGLAGNPDRRYRVMGDTVPLHVRGILLGRMYTLTACELGTVPYWVPAPTPNLTARPTTDYSSI
jgi:hypothetical protein